MKPYITIREIESLSPCCEEYAAFLSDIRSNPAKKGCRWGDGDCSLTLYKRLRKPQYGPDDRIALETILDTPSTRGSYPPFERVRWILFRATCEGIKRLAPICGRLPQNRYELSDESARAALQPAKRKTAVKKRAK